MLRHSIAGVFDNPDPVAIVIHNYLRRQTLAEGEPKYDDLERRIATGPVIGARTIPMDGDVNGAPHPKPTRYRAKFTGQ